MLKFHAGNNPTTQNYHQVRKRPEEALLVSIGFIIMQIGNLELDKMCEQVIVPAMRESGLDPKRVDKHNDGGLLKKEILSFIQQAEIIVADLTNERPNCYLEIGYTMGVDKLRNLILTAREDHNVTHATHPSGGPKVHFDLSGYDILFWNPNDLEGFRIELIKRIHRRLAVIRPARPISPWNTDWLEEHQLKGSKGLELAGVKGFMEIRFALSSSKINRGQRDLLTAARRSTIPTFGWPIGVVADDREDFRPKPREDGLVAEISQPEHKMYDYWALRKDGDFYFLGGLFEDAKNPFTGQVKAPDSLYFNTRIVQVTEALLYCARLYTNLDVSGTTTVHIAVRHGGLNGRSLTATASRAWSMIPMSRRTIVDQITATSSISLDGIEADLVNQVKILTKDLFAVFDFFEPDHSVYEDIVNKFVEGQVT
jgi:hypothetical protein